jgi:mycothiol system anti-sigma-R factor
MICAEARIGLYALLDDELGIAQNVEVLGHLESCTLCQRECEVDARLKALVRDHLSADSVPENLWQRVAQGIHREDAAAHRTGRVVEQLRTRGPALASSVWQIRPAWVTLAVASVIMLSIMLGRLAGGPSYVVDEIVTDHVHSVVRVQGPVDVPSADSAALLAELRQRIPLPARVPVFPTEEVKLLGGSVCQLRITKGIRLTYAVGERTLSFYQLERPSGATFPMAGAGRLFVEYVDGQHGPGLVLWGDDRFLYALVAELPTARLAQLAAQI